MTSLKRPFRNNLQGLFVLLLVLLSCRLSWAGLEQGGPYTLIKDLPGATGGENISGGIYSLAYAFGEQTSGFTASNTNDLVISGYYGGRYGNGQAFQLLRSQVGSTAFYQDGLQVGVAPQASVELDFSDQLTSSTIPTGITVTMRADHLGQDQNVLMPFQWTYDPSTSKVVVTPQTAWEGNTLYDVTINAGLLSVDGFILDADTHVQFLTMLDPHQENVVVHPILKTGAPAQPTTGAGTPRVLNIDIPAGSLADFSMVLFSKDPLSAPLRVDPQMVRDANQKAADAGGSYRTPLAMQEIVAYNSQGQITDLLSLPASITMSYDASNGLLNGVASSIRPRTLALWVLDETHHLWVKLPGSQVTEGNKTVTAAVTHFSVYALMGGADGSASDVYVFPVPWRPHGPGAGTASGQTGTDAGGLTFTNLPSECTVRIYTISGERVRELHHSDTAGLIAQEKWDAATTHGDPVASGVYLWRVESTMDSKNGKLMIIR